MKRKKNPVPASSTQRLIEQGSALYERFSGHDAELIGRVPKPVIPKVLIAIGEIDGILYTTVRDGVREKYIHRFRKKSRPLLAVAPDGKSMVLLGGAYQFTESGINDR